MATPPAPKPSSLLTMVKQVNVSEMVTCTHHLLEFNSYHINQVIDNRYKLFTIGDIMSYVEMGRHEYAIAILRQVSDVFKEVNAELLNCGLDESFDSMSSVAVDWNRMRDDSSLVEMIDSQDISSFFFKLILILQFHLMTQL